MPRTSPAVFFFVLATIGPLTVARDLTFEDRVRAQEAIERVYYAHQIGAALPFGDAVPREVLEAKVRTYLQQSAALAERWNAPIDATALARELARMVDRTRMPDRLAELFAALGDDSFVIQETLARGVLADRLARARFDREPSRDGAREGRDWDRWWARAADSFDPFAVRAVAVGGRLQQPRPPAATASTCVSDNTWDNGSLDSLPDERQGHTAVWTGSRVIVWGGYDTSGPLNTGVVYDPVTDSSTPTSTLAAPHARRRHTAVWTGNRMIVWGGLGEFGGTRSGGRYDPLTDTWAATALVPAPQARAGHSAIWTGSRMIVWGGSTVAPLTYLASGGRYNPASDTWSPTSTVGAPSARDGHTAIWTGSLLVVWGGIGSAFDSSGGRYDPVTDSWTGTSLIGAPSPRLQHTAIWTGSRMVVWGGAGTSSMLQDGSRYDAVADTWSATSTVGAPAARVGHTAVWTGSRMVVWGGESQGGSLLDTGGRYDPIGNSWAATSTAGSPSGRVDHTAVWTDSFMVVWGTGLGVHSTGGRWALGQSADGDGDGLSECGGDCNDGNASVLAVPGDVQNLRWISRTTLAWDSEASTSGSGTTYDAMYGDLADVSDLSPNPGDTCLASDTAELAVADASPDPAHGEGWFFLVRAHNLCGDGRWETATDGSDRTPRACEACDCCAPNYTLGCEAPQCEAVVCTVDPFCCNVAWDILCEYETGCLCFDCGSCCDGKPNSARGCNDANCEAVVCAIDETCCIRPPADGGSWHAGCAELAAEHCDCCAPGASSFGGTGPAEDVSKPEHGGPRWN